MQLLEIQAPLRIGVRRCYRNFENIGGEGRDLNPRVVLPTATNKPAAALANGDLSSFWEPA